MRDERPVNQVPGSIRAALLIALLLQCLWHVTRPPPVAQAQDLPAPPALAVMRATAFGEQELLGKMIMLWLQAFDNQPGLSVPFRELDYARVIDWLRTIMALDPAAQYPLLSASRLYAEVPDPGRQRQMLTFVEQAFLDEPDLRWQWLAHAVFIAKYRLRDLDLALGYAQLLARQTDSASVPGWARQMHIFVLEDMGELEAAKVELGGLIESGEISDQTELQFLYRRLDQIEARSREF